MEKTVPAVTQGEYDFYEKQKLAEDYNLKNHQTSMVEPMINEKGEDMEPALLFHQFLFLLGLIAKENMK